MVPLLWRLDLVRIRLSLHRVVEFVHRIARSWFRLLDRWIPCIAREVARWLWGAAPSVFVVSRPIDTRSVIECEAVKRKQEKEIVVVCRRC